MDRNVITAGKDTLVFVEADKCYKVFGPDSDKATVLNEALNQALVEETGLHIPKLFEVTTVDGNWAIVSQYIRGKTMAELLDMYPEKEDVLLTRFVDIQREIQSKRCPLLTKHRDKMNRKISETDLSATLRYDLHNRIESSPRYNDLCHGDLDPSNVIISEDDEAYIIDWSHATQGNREADAARTFLLFLLDGKKERAKKYLRTYCGRTGCSRKEILGWIPILAASQSVKGIRHQTDFLHSLIYLKEEELESLDE
ncbi:MAG: phosphotransferase [Oscillospiraceae bacterium]|jgi:tRNA A-37 threonylcarbamoyl transferase component Bud32|nr:phosphotransferase [Oscillospiraceae bacterium]MBQ4240420.1 phosphotransferase [Oscillospiraceae bacterium]